MLPHSGGGGVLVAVHKVNDDCFNSQILILILILHRVSRSIPKALRTMRPALSLQLIRLISFSTRIKPVRPLTSTLLRANIPQSKTFSSSRMSFSNTNTGDKPADPYTAKNHDEPGTKDKIEDLSNFITSCKFGMMTTRDAASGSLVSRCMALADKVMLRHPYQATFLTIGGKRRC